jgi:hypothetical protein
MSHTFALPPAAKAARKSSVTGGATPTISRSSSSALSRNSIVLLDLSVVYLAYWIARRILLAYTTLRLGIASFREAFGRSFSDVRKTGSWVNP